MGKLFFLQGSWPKNAPAEVTEVAPKEACLHEHVDRMLFYILTAACKGAAFEMVRHATGVLWVSGIEEVAQTAQREHVTEESGAVEKVCEPTTRGKRWQRHQV